MSGKIGNARFANMSKRYEQERGTAAELKKLEDKRMDVDASWNRCNATPMPPPSPSAYLPSAFCTSRFIRGVYIDFMLLYKEQAL